MTLSPPRAVVDLFAGPGGWDVAARDLGLDPLGIEWDAAACATRAAAGLRTIQADVAALDPVEFGPVDGLIASPPCQGFSMAGKGKGRLDGARIRRAAIQLAHGRDRRSEYEWADPRSPLVLEPLRWAVALRPEWLAFEQVPAVLPVWELYAKLLEARGYWTWTGYLHAEQFGVPQTRKRAFLVASRVGAVAPPVPTHSRYYPRDKARLDLGVLPWVSMAEALGWGMTERPSYTVTAGGGAQGGIETFANSARQGMGREAERGAWTLVNGAQKNATRRGLNEPAPTKGGHDTANRRWTFERPSITVNCDPRISAPGRHNPNESGSQQKDAVRVTVEQAAVLQSFPADYPWQGTKTKQFEQVGNAVPPGLAKPVLVAASMASADQLREAA